jgi:hypothetical protein
MRLQIGGHPEGGDSRVKDPTSADGFTPVERDFPYVYGLGVLLVRRTDLRVSYGPSESYRSRQDDIDCGRAFQRDSYVH